MHRYYFHLVKGQEVIPDDLGVEVADLAQARVEAGGAAREFLKEHAGTVAGLEDWCIEVADASGAVAFRVHLAGLSRNGPRPA